MNNMNLVNNIEFINFMNALNNMNNVMNNNMNNNMNNSMNDMINFMNQINNNMNINNINNLNNNMNYSNMINNINFNMNIIYNNLNNIITSMKNINNILLMQQNINYTPINFIKEIINKNIQFANQISDNNNLINLTINNPLLFPNTNNINTMNNQFPNSNLIPRQEKKINDLFPGNNNRRICIIFDNTKGNKTPINAPVNIKVKDLLLVYAKKMEISPDLLGKKINFILNGKKININEEKDLISFGLERGIRIIVDENQNVMGGNLNS